MKIYLFYPPFSDPTKRPTAADLLQHPFLMNLDKSFQFKDYMDRGKI